VLYTLSLLDVGTAVGVGGMGISHQVSTVSTEEVLDLVEEVKVDVILLRGDEVEVVEDLVDARDNGKGLDIRTREGEGRSDESKCNGRESVRDVGEIDGRDEYNDTIGEGI
jgi:hypothetical protein